MKPGEFVRRWTPEEVDFLRTHNDSLTYQEISEKLGRTRNAVQTKAQEIGIRKSQEFINRKAQITQFKPGHVSVIVGRVYANAWKEHEYQYLIDNYENKTCNEIAAALNRTPGAVKTVAGKVLKLKKSTEAKKLIAKRPNAGQFSAGKSPINTLYNEAVVVRTTKGRKSKWIRLGPKNWEQLHRYNWREAGNDIPKGYVLRFIDGNPLNCEVENLQLILRGRHSRFSPEWEAKRRMEQEVKLEREGKRKAQQAIIEQARELKLQQRKSKAEAKEIAKLLRQARKMQKAIEKAEKNRLREEALQAQAEEKARLRQQREAEKQQKRPTRKAARVSTVRVRTEPAERKRPAVRKRPTSLEDRRAQRLAEREQRKAQAELERQEQRKRLELQRAAERKLASQRKERRRIEEEQNKKLPTRAIDYNQLVPLKINEKTTIYIKPGQDPEQARQKWMNKYSNQARI